MSVNKSVTVPRGRSRVSSDFALLACDITQRLIISHENHEGLVTLEAMYAGIDFTLVSGDDSDEVERPNPWAVASRKVGPWGIRIDGH